MIQLAILIAAMAIATTANAQTAQVYGPFPNTGDRIYLFAATVSAPPPASAKVKPAKKVKQVQVKKLDCAECESLEQRLRECEKELRSLQEAARSDSQPPTPAVLIVQQRSRLPVTRRGAPAASADEDLTPFEIKVAPDEVK